MSVRAIQARIDCDREVLEHLWRTHCVFHERLLLVLNTLFKMRRGQLGNTARRRKLAKAFAAGLLRQDAKNAYDRVLKATNSSARNTTARNALSGLKEKEPDLVQEYEAAFDEFVQGWRPLAELRSNLLDLPKFLESKLYQEAVAIISGHDELVSNWKTAHAEWLEDKRAWEETPENKLYLALRPRFDDFEKQVAGKVGKRRGRWHRYFDWLRKNPQLAAWRGGQAVVNAVSPQAEQRIRRAKPSKVRSIEAAEFWKANPELAALNKLHGYYERHFVRRRKQKRNSDNFDHRPTFTRPHSVRHPRWFVFNAPQTNPAGYRRLVLPSGAKETGSIQLQLLAAHKTSDGNHSAEWVQLRFRADPRMSRFRMVQIPTTVKRGKAKGQAKTKQGYQFFDPHFQQLRPAEISGAKLMFRDIRLHPNGTLKFAVPYLIFTCSTDDLPLTEQAKRILWTESGEITKSGKKKKSRALPDQFVACAIDLGLRNVGFATLCAFDQGNLRVLRSRNIWLDKDHTGPDLAHIAQHKLKINRLRRKRGKPVKGEESHIELQDHITNMGQDRFKKAARGIINFAWNVDGARDKTTDNALPRADLIILERLEGFIPDAEKERGINRALAAWNRGQLVARLREMAEDAGYKGRVFEVHPAGTSQVCSKCGRLGRRYSISRDSASHKSDIKFGWVEKLFACPCGYRANADHNASVNLQRKFLMGEDAVQSFFAWRNQTQEEREREIDKLDLALRKPLQELHNLQSINLEDPF